MLVGRSQEAEFIRGQMVLHAGDKMSIKAIMMSKRVDIMPSWSEQVNNYS